MDRWSPKATFGLVLVVAFITAVTAIAGPSLGPPPEGWRNAASGPARGRAEAWAEALDGRLYQVFEPRDRDDFEETLAVVEVVEAFDVEADPEDQVSAIASQLLEGPFAISDAKRIDGDAPIDVAQVDADELRYRVAVASGGPSRGIVVLVTKADEASLYGGVFEDAVANLSGLAPPLQRIELGVWWALALLLYLIGGGLVAVVSLQRDLADGIPQAVRWAGLACAGLGLLVGVVAYVTLGGSESSLALDGMSRGGAATQFGLVGVGIGVGALVVGAIWQRLERPVRSAPAAGVFSGQRSPQAARQPPGAPPHPDGDSWLQDAEEGSHHDLGQPGPITFSPPGPSVPSGFGPGSGKPTGGSDRDPGH